MQIVVFTFVLYLFGLRFSLSGSKFLFLILVTTCSVAERVAWERGEAVGKSVGYVIRLESAQPRPRGSILYCTTGILLRRLQVALETVLRLQDRP